MKLSIITINFNNYDGLLKTIKSVISQTFKDFEWIVIDGGSTDGSRELIEQYSDYFAFWVSEPDKGIYNAMNKGIMAAKGDYLQFLNSGDWLLDEGVLEHCFLCDFTADVYYGDVFFVKSDGSMVRRYYPEYLTLRFLYKTSLGHSATFIKRELLLDELYDEDLRIVSDWAFFLKQALNGSKFEHLNMIVTCFDTTGISSTNNELMESERQRVINSLLPEALVRDNNNMDKMEDIVNDYHVKRVIELGRKNKFYHKLITGFLFILGLIDKTTRLFI